MVLTRRSFLLGGLLLGVTGVTGGYGVCPPAQMQPRDKERVPESDLSRLVWNPEYSFTWMKEGFYPFLALKHPSPVAKYELTYRRLRQVAQIPCNAFASSPPLGEEDFLRVHNASYLEELERLAHSFGGYGGLFNGENPIDPHILDFIRASCAGTYHAGVLALEHGRAMNLSGGFHHAFPDHAEGFCHLNDVAIAIKKLQSESRIQRAIIVDGDVHHGNGNAFIFRDDDTVEIVDIYQSDNYPSQKIPVEYPIALDSREGITDDRYLSELRSVLPMALERFKPDIAFYLNGADPYQNDKLGGFQLTLSGLEKRDRFVLETTRDFGIPTAVVLAGGYPQRVEDAVAVHYSCASMVARL